MANKNKPDLKVFVDTYLPDNTSAQISPKDIRDSFYHVIDSSASIDTNVTPESSGVAFWVSGSGVSYENNFVWDSSNNRIGINAAITTYHVDINGGSIRIRTSNPPSSSSESCYQGEIRWGTDSGTSYIYVCVSDDTWRRMELAPFQKG